MDHLYWEERLQGFVDNELGPADSLAMQEHINSCQDCQANLNYICSLKKRLRAHADTIHIPLAVEERLVEQFTKRRRRTFLSRRQLLTGSGMAMALAAALVMGMLLPRSFEPSNSFVECILEGQVVCHDCTLADRAGLQAGILCSDGHEMGLQTSSGELWRFADDENGHQHLTNLALYGKQVRIYGQALHDAHLLRIKNLEAQKAIRASL